MKISRTVFLALTGAIASSTACHVYTDVPPPPPPPPPAASYPYATTYTYQSRTAPISTSPSTEGVMKPPPPTGTLTGYEGPQPGQRQLSPYIPIRNKVRRRVGMVTADPGYRPPSPSLPSTNGLTGPSTEGTMTPPPPTGTIGAPPPPPTGMTPPPFEGCLDTENMGMPDCSHLHVDASCPTRAFILQRCETYRTYMDSKVATAAINCMSGMTSAQMCLSTSAYDCGKQALSESCEDSGLTQMCQIAASSCHTTANDCTALLSGLNDAGKQEVAKCIGKGCEAGLCSCVEGLSSKH